jgi:Gly-Xaa carboxypeptidase
MATISTEKQSLEVTEQPLKALHHRSSIRRFAVVFVLLCIILPLNHHQWLPILRPSMSEGSQCPQMEPMFPSANQTLQKLFDYTGTDVFKTESIQRLSGSVQIPTMSFDDLGPVGDDQRWEIFYELASYLNQTFPLIHGSLQLEMINVHGLLYTWPGSDPSLKPTLLMAHQDVVPVPESTISAWTHPPFSGFCEWNQWSNCLCNNLLILSLVFS